MRQGAGGSGTKIGMNKCDGARMDANLMKMRVRMRMQMRTPIRDHKIKSWKCQELGSKEITICKAGLGQVDLVLMRFEGRW